MGGISAWFATKSGAVSNKQNMSIEVDKYCYFVLYLVKYRHNRYHLWKVLIARRENHAKHTENFWMGGAQLWAWLSWCCGTGLHRGYKGPMWGEGPPQRWKEYFSFCESGIKNKYFLPFFTSFEKVLALNKVETQMLHSNLPLHLNFD